MDVNILVNMGVAEDSFTGIEMAIVTNLMSRKTEYGDIAGLFAKSQGEHVEAMKELILKEQETVGKLAELFSEMVKMLRAASTSLGEVENNYATNRVE